MLPYLEVSHLPSSSSFFAAIVQPLGLRYLSTKEGHFPSVIYGDTRQGIPVFQLKQITASAERPVRRSHIALSASSAAALEDALAFAVRARGSSSRTAASRSTSGDRVLVTDFDGNTMEIIYRPPPDYPSHYGGPTVRRTQSTNDEASRILDWNYNVASSDHPASTRTAGRRPYSGRAGEEGEPYSSLRRSITAGPPVYDASASPRQNSHGMSTSTVVGALLGAAAGAALTYGLVKSDRARAPRQEFDAPPFTRRSTFPDPHPEPRSRYVEVERAVEKIRYPDGYPPVVVDHRPAPEYIARYSHAGRPRSRDPEDAYEDSRGRRSPPRSRASTRTRSEAAADRQPLMLTDTEHRSQVSRSSRHPPIVQRSYTYETPERESFVSARSQRSSSTVRAPAVVPVQSSKVVSRSRSGTRITTTTVKVGGDSSSSRALSRPGTHVSARNIGLPLSGVGSSHANWEDDDDSGSVVPDDSISCVGSRRSGRAYY